MNPEQIQITVEDDVLRLHLREKWIKAPEVMLPFWRRRDYGK
ncbi:hypothetical protein LCGC14_1119700 [marine sediment metagenome]|uniref:Uncharacterized protein n=1 Tax=marine sediment metagenome TaxID=412755 RepID=A0A0F9M953_9ZZZZ